MPNARTATKRGLARLGYELRRTSTTTYDDRTTETIEAVRPYTMTSPERIAAVCDAIRYVVRYQIAGAIVECGVWAGGSAMAAARTLSELGEHDRDLYLFDTFEGMSEPSAADVDMQGKSAADLLRTSTKDELVWCYASMETVRRNISATGYSSDRVHFVQGMVEDTIPDRAPDQIALLRLDTDWYESTRHELAHLVPRMAPNGVLIIDDYGHWQGARRAVDEWLMEFDRPVLLSRIDYSGRMAIVGNASR